jgi:hypothetical protein
VVGSNDTKFAYLLSLDAPDVDLDLVYAALDALQKNGTIEIVKAAPKPSAAKKAKKERSPRHPNQSARSNVITVSKPRASLLP